MRFVSAIAMFLVAIASAAQADISEDAFRKCSAIPNDAIRLWCFDGLSPDGPPAGSDDIRSHGDIGKWERYDYTDPMTDKEYLVLVLSTSSGISSSRRSYKIFLRCGPSREMELFIDLDKFMNSGKIRVDSRFGKSEIFSVTWAVSDDRKAIFYDGDVPTYLEKMLTDNRLIVRVYGKHGRTITGQFDITGLKAAIVPLKKACPE